MADRLSYCAMVGYHVFLSLSGAETYCRNHEIDPENIVPCTSLEAKQEALTIVRAQKAILDTVKEKLADHENALWEEACMCAKNQNDCHPLEKGYWTDRTQEARGKDYECRDIMHLLFEIREPLEILTGWQD